MIRMGIRELRNTLTTTIRRVQGGETIEITHHQRPVAMLTPIRADRIQAMIDSGEMTPAGRFEPPRRPVPATTGISASDALQEDRAER